MVEGHVPQGVGVQVPLSALKNFGNRLTEVFIIKFSPDQSSGLNDLIRLGD